VARVGVPDDHLPISWRVDQVRGEQYAAHFRVRKRVLRGGVETKRLRTGRPIVRVSERTNATRKRTIDGGDMRYQFA
jgi:hypothetical protein